MEKLDLMAVLAAMAYLSACLRLYLTPSQAKAGTWASAFLLAALAAPWFGHGNANIVRLFPMAGFLFHFCAWNRPERGFLPHGAFAAVFLIASAATRSEFGYLLLPWLSGNIAGWLFTKRPVFRKGMTIASLALAACLPMQIMAYMNGAFLPGDDSPARDFYTLTLPESHWLGDAVPMRIAFAKPELFASQAEFLAGLKRGHAESDRGAGETGNESAFWRQGFRNIKTHPAKFLQNWRANLNRLVFDFPLSRAAAQSAAIGTGNRAFANAMLFLIVALCAYPLARAGAGLPPEISVIMAWTAAGLTLRSFLSAGSDAVLPWAPGLCLGICLTFGLVVRVGVKVIGEGGARAAPQG